MTLGGLDERRVVLVCVVLYAAVASQTRPLTDAAAVAVAVPAGAVLILAGTDRAAADRGGIDPGLRRTAALWAAVVALAAAWEFAAWLQQPAYNVASYEHPTASALLDPVIQPCIPRFAAWCFWLYAGYRVVRP